MKKIKLIYNSIAGQSRFKYFLDSILEKFTENGYEVSIFRASKKNANNLEEYIKNIKGTYAIVIAGGDGTINRVINIMKKNNIDVPIGIVPAGTANDFAMHVGMPSSFGMSIDKILNGTPQEIDLGLVNDNYFINVCAAGVCTNASHTTDLVLKNNFGMISYIFTAIYEFFKFKPFDVKIETETDVYIEKINVFVVLNGSTAGGIKFLDNNSLQDGLLDIIILKDCNVFRVIKVLFKILFGKHISEKFDNNIIYLKEKNVKISRIKGKCDEPGVDGDEGPKFPIDIKCVEKAIKILI